MLRGVKLWRFFLVLGLAPSLPGHAQQPASDPASTNAISTNAAPATADAQPDATQVDDKLHEALELAQQGNTDAALESVNAAVAMAPRSVDAYILRGSIYSEKKRFDLAEKDFQMVLQIDGNNVLAQFNLSEIKFRQKEYDAARPGFIPLEKDDHLGDLSLYKVFLCDLFGGHEDVAAKELDAFNQTGSNASYYLANAAWSLYHHQTEDARGWLASAARIYSHDKFNLYTISLHELGYLPLPAPSSP